MAFKKFIFFIFNKIIMYYILMNRKTNIFYHDSSNSNDSKFLTFSNYTNALTGDILVTNMKLFPSRFICAYIPNLNKDEFVKNYLESYYENKLAFLRDKLSNDQQDELMNPLGYLIECITKYVKDQSSDNSEDDISITDINNNIFTFISEIVEMDYNGTYTDIICTISPKDRKKPTFISNSQSNYNIGYDQSSSSLYGWSNNENITGYDIHNKTLIFDSVTDNTNNYNTTSSTISLRKESITGELKFNVIIPLYEIQYLDNEETSNLNEDNNVVEFNNNYDVPIGIYFCDDTISLAPDITGYAPNWSLMISMQFSPFPYSYDIIHNYDDSTAIKDAYLTFAQILSRQTDVIDLMNKYNEMITTLKTKINQIESALNNVSSVNNIDYLTNDINNINNSLEEKFNEYDRKIYELTEIVNNSKLTWTVKNN